LTPQTAGRRAPGGISILRRSGFFLACPRSWLPSPAAPISSQDFFRPCFFSGGGTVLALCPWHDPLIELDNPAESKVQGEGMSNKLLLIIVGVLFILVLGLGGGMFMIWSKMKSLSDHTSATEGGKHAEKAKAEQEGKMVSLDSFIVNLADSGGNRYLRVTMDLEVVGGKPAEDEMTKRIPQVRDAILMILPVKRYSDISTTEGKTAMREELIGAVNSLLSVAKVNRIYFKEFVIQ
jgi:flagellar protein FliL